MEVWNSEIDFTKRQELQLLRNTKIRHKGPDWDLRGHLSLQQWEPLQRRHSSVRVVEAKRSCPRTVSNSVSELAMAFLPLGSLCWVLSLDHHFIDGLTEVWNCRCFPPINIKITGKENWIWRGGSFEEHWQDALYASEPAVLYDTFRTWRLNYSFSNHQFPFFSVISLFNILHGRDLWYKFYKLVIKI